MKVVALQPYPSGVYVVVFVYDGASEALVYRDNLKLASDDNLAKTLTRLRTRVYTLVEQQSPDVVVIKPLETDALRRTRARPKPSWFRSAEVRGVVAEASYSACQNVEFWSGTDVTRSIGARRGKEYLTDEAFWADVDGEAVPKAYRPVSLLAISKLRSLAIGEATDSDAASSA